MAEPVKGFGLIERFSEDIDLIFDWRLLGYRVDDPWEKRGNTKQDAFVRQINEDAASFLREALIPEMQTHLGGNTTRGFSRAAMSLDIKKCWSLPHHFYPRDFQGGVSRPVDAGS